MRLYTRVQLAEVLLFCAVLMAGVVTHRPSVVVFGGGLLLGKAVLNILAPEGGTVVRRSVMGFGARYRLHAGRPGVDPRLLSVTR